MVVIVMENAPESLRGELTRWMLEPKAGVFVGKINPVVREELWKKVCDSDSIFGSLIIYNAQTEQGYEIKSRGTPKRIVIDLEGLQFIQIK